VPAPPDSAASARVGLSAVILSVDETTPRLLAVEGSGGREALPSTHLDDRKDRTLEQGVRRLVGSEIGVPVRYFEQLYTFGNRGRAPGGREVAVAYLALARYQPVHGPRNPSWRNCYELFPWEDWRDGRPRLLDKTILPALERWLASAAPGEVATRRERAEVTFGFGHARWDPVRVLDRYELAYELKLVREATAAADGAAVGPGPGLGLPLVLDHRRIAAAALERLRGKLAYRPVVFEVLPETFTLSRLQQVVEALAGQVLHKQNFRRLVGSANLVEPTGEWDQRTGGRPAEMYRFRREVLTERPAPGLGLRRLGGL
jgi:hypothetical protein